MLKKKQVRKRLFPSQNHNFRLTKKGEQVELLAFDVYQEF